MRDDEVVPIFIGYDPKEAVTYHTCAQSIIETCSDPLRLAFRPVCGPQRDGSNTFIYARFLVPWLCGFRGHALFLDGDMVVRDDILKLWALRRSGVGVQVVKHDYQTKHPVKYLGYKNEDYPRKNWSSVMLWSCGYCPNERLTPEFIADKSGAYLHRFQWLKDEQIGDLPSGWNRLVMEQDIEPDDALLHYTIGSPCFADYADCDGAEDWHAMHQRSQRPLNGQ